MTAPPPVATLCPLSMVQLPLDGRRLFTFARDQGLLDADPGYVVHALLAALFGREAPQPFALPVGWHGLGRGDPTLLPVLAYGHQPLQALQEMAQALALPAVYRSVLWDEAGCKPMPARFPAGLALGFEVRACPVVRIGRGNRHLAPGSEVDAVVAAHLAAEDGRSAKPDSRESVYRAWLVNRIVESGAALPSTVEVSAMRSTRLYRRGARGAKESASQQWPSAWLQRPDIRFRGRLEVIDSEAFSRWLVRGVGRHRAFGFGMVLLRSA